MTDDRELDGLLRDVLSRTSGPACPAAEERLAAFVDGELHGLDHRLVHRHARACASCGSLAVALERMRGDLPGLARLSPGAGFAAHVLAATSRSGAPRRSRARRALGGLGRLLQRPRLQFEAAYLGAFVVWLLVIAPFAPLSELPGRVIALFDSNVETSLPAQARRVWDETGAVGVASLREVGTEIDARVARTRDGRADVGRGTERLAEALVVGDPGIGEKGLDGLGDGLSDIWTAMTRPAPRPAVPDDDTQRTTLPEGDRP